MEEAHQTFDPAGGIILIQTKITSPDVTQTARLVFDTGATYCMLPWWMVNQMGIEIDQDQVVSTTTASSVESSPIIEIPSMEVLGHKVENVKCIVRDLPPIAGIDGLLGLSFLKNFRVEIDFIDGELTLWDE